MTEVIKKILKEKEMEINIIKWFTEAVGNFLGGFFVIYKDLSNNNLIQNYQILME